MRRWLQYVGDDAQGPVVHGVVVGLALQNLGREVHRCAAGSGHELLGGQFGKAEVGYFEDCLFVLGGPEDVLGLGQAESTLISRCTIFLEWQKSRASVMVSTI